MQQIHHQQISSINKSDILHLIPPSENLPETLLYSNTYVSNANNNKEEYPKTLKLPFCFHSTLSFLLISPISSHHSQAFFCQVYLPFNNLWLFLLFNFIRMT